MAATGWLRRRARVVGTAVAAGLLVGLAATAGLSATRSTHAARSTVFSLGALVFGFGTLGWSSSILFGTGIENAQRHLDTGTDWNEADSRRAMARIGSFGAGVMVAVPLLAVAVRIVAGLGAGLIVAVLTIAAGFGPVVV
jgi:hypothetical protein